MPGHETIGRVGSNGTSPPFEQKPSPALRPFLKSFLVVEFPTVHHDSHLPDTGAVAAFSFLGECHIGEGRTVPPTAFTGLHSTLRTHEHRGGHSAVLALFTPAGAAAFLRSPLEDFTETTTELADAFGRHADLTGLLGRIADASTHAQRVNLLEDFLVARLRVPEPDPLVTAAITWLETRRDTRRITDLASYIGLSQSALERRFRRIVGITPGKYASLVRLRRAIRLRNAGTNLTSLAQSAGYYDQSHFIHDFRRATGSAPEAFFHVGT